MIVAGDYVTVHIDVHWPFHRQARCETQGKGQPIAFIATDLVRVEDGRITDNWHIEDNPDPAPADGRRNGRPLTVHTKAALGQSRRFAPADRRVRLSSMSDLH